MKMSAQIFDQKPAMLFQRMDVFKRFNRVTFGGAVIFLLFSYTGYSYGFEPSEENCQDIAGYIKEKYGENLNRYVFREECLTVTDANDEEQIKCENTNEQITNSAWQDIYNEYKEKCEKWEEQKKEEVERLQEQVEKEEEKLEKRKQEEKEAKEKMEQMQKEKESKCERSHSEFTRRRDAIEKEVKSNENQIDKIENEINKKYSELSKMEDEYSGKLLRHRQQRRQMELALEDKKEQIDQVTRTKLNEINQAIDRIYLSLERLEQKLQTAQDNRMAAYIEEYSKCYNKAFEQVESERTERIKYIQEHGSYEAASMEDLFTSDPQSMERFYHSRIQEIKRNCFIRRVGANTLSATRNIKKDTQNPNALRIETQYHNQVNDLEMQKKASYQQLETRKKQMAEVEEQNNKALKQYKKKSADLEKNFKDEIKQMKKNKETKRQAIADQVIGLIEQKLRISAEDPRRHFVEEVQIVYRDCCFKGGDSTRCQQLGQYSQDLHRTQFTRVKSSGVRQFSGGKQ